MSKGLAYLAITIGGAIGSYLPVILLHQDSLGLLSILGGVVGGLAGIYLAYRISN
jgi:hypothetical protein